MNLFRMKSGSLGRSARYAVKCPFRRECGWYRGEIRPLLYSRGFFCTGKKEMEEDDEGKIRAD